MARRKRHEEHANHERWLVSYADFITLLFAFFVTMYSISRVDGKKFGSAVDSIHRAMGTVVPLNMPMGAPGFFDDIQNKNPLSESVTQKIDLKKLLAMDLGHGPGIQNIRVTMDDRGIVISFPDMCLFAPCSADLRPQALPALHQLSQGLMRVNSPVKVEGHTDSGRCASFPSNWELSTARASAVVRFLIEQGGMNPARLSASGYAQYRPVDTNETPSGQAMNRRVDVVLLNKDAQKDEPRGVTDVAASPGVAPRGP
jgi:chemotaxis protein MotB